MSDMPQGTCPRALPSSSATYVRTYELTKTLTHLSDKWSPSVTHARVQDFGRMVENRARYALLSEVGA